MPGDDPDSAILPGVAGRDIADMLAPQGRRRQSLPGFDADYADIVDYIVRCTHRIWEQKDIGLIETHYADDCLMHLMTGPVAGRRGIVANTLQTLGAFPDRTLVGEAVIWRDNGDGSFLSSHRITSQGLNLGASEFGPATGRRAGYTTIADCLCRANMIVEEWLVRDNSALVLALGLSPRAVARAQAAADRAGRQQDGPAPWRAAAMQAVRDRAVTPFPTAPLPDATRDPEAFARAVFDAIWGHQRIGLVREAYDPAAHWQGPGGRRLFGHGEIAGWAVALQGSFGDARTVLDHVAVTPVANREGAHDVALRWMLAGKHDGPALYGPPTGRPAYILGCTHWRVEHGRIVDEVTVFDEVALLRQLEGGL